ncbi:MAG: preprotein translocase subunit SecG [Elusimicrobia bacterium]|nr:preprotein translocase subunit SecG [Elusimicrobiota bacterium]
MYNFFLVIHIIICLLLIVSILFFQTSKGSALSMFGGGGDSLFSSPSGSSFVKKFTMWLALAFAVNSLVLTILSPTRYRSVLYDASSTAPVKK